MKLNLATPSSNALTTNHNSRLRAAKERIMFTSLVLSLAIGYDQPIDTKQAACLASAIYFEARDQPLAGQAAVAQVILNRSVKRKLTPCEVIHQRKQFSFTLTPYSVRAKAFNEATQADTLAKTEAAQVALQSLTGAFNGMVSGNTHYFNPAKADPSWQYSLDNAVVIGDHKFLY